MITLPTPTNCWSANVERFATALASSPAFWTMTGATDSVSAAEFIFGQRMTNPRSGRTWTADELKSLSGYGMVFTDYAAPYGKRFNEGGRQSILGAPKGAVCIELSRAIPDDELIGQGDYFMPTDVHDRQSMNIFGTILDQIAAELDANGGLYSIGGADVLFFGETPPDRIATEGCRQSISSIWSYSVPM